MKNLLKIILFAPLLALAQPTPAGGPPAASQAEVDAGLVKNKYVSPFTLANWTGGGGGGAVTSVFGRTGIVTAEENDYATFYFRMTADNTSSGVNTFSGSFIYTPVTITITTNSGLFDITKGFSRATNSANTTLVMSAAGTDGQQVYLNAINSDTAAHTWTIDNVTGTDPTFTAAAGITTPIKLQSNGTVWTIVGGAPTINDLSTVAPASGDFLMLWDITSGTTIKATAATTLALYDSQAATMTAKTMQLSGALGTDDTLEGITVSGLTAGATIAQWEVVYVGGSSTYLLADANGSSTYPARGLAVAAYSSTNAAIIVVRGTVRNDAWTWTPGGTIYLSGTPGALTQTAPITSGDKVQAIGFALTADIAFFDFDSTYVTVQ